MNQHVENLGAIIATLITLRATLRDHDVCPSVAKGIEEQKDALHCIGLDLRCELAKRSEEGKESQHLE